MKIRTNLILQSAAFVILITTMGLIMFRTFGGMNREIKRGNMASKMIKDIFELNIVTYEYLMHHEKRMQQQWLRKYDSIDKILEKMRKEEIHPEHLSMLESVTTSYEPLGDLFSQLQANFAERKRLIEENNPQAKINLSLVVEERLMAEVLMRSLRITAEALRFSAMTEQTIVQTQQRANLIIILSIIGFAIFSSCISFLSIRAITRPINKLIKGAAIIGKGDLEHKIDLKTKNEMGQLANSFNKMTKDLKETTVSRDELEKEVTERKRAEEALRESETRFRTLVERLPATTYTAALDESSTTLYISPQIEKMLGIPPEEYKTDPDFWLEHLHDEDRERVLREVSRAHETGQPFVSEYRMISTDGRIVWLGDEAVIVKDEKGNPLYLQGVMFDITERKRAEEELQKHREHLEEIVDKRTAELRKTVNLMVGREVRMAELKKTIGKLRAQVESAGLTPVADDPIKEEGSEK